MLAACGAFHEAVLDFDAHLPHEVVRAYVVVVQHVHHQLVVACGARRGRGGAVYQLSQSQPIIISITIKIHVQNVCQQFP